MLKNFDKDLALAFVLLIAIVLGVTFLAVRFQPRPQPDVVIPFPPQIPEDLHGTYWLLLKGSAGSNLEGVHTEFTSPTDPTWMRKEALWVDDQGRPYYEWMWEQNGKLIFDIRGYPGTCYQIGDQLLEVSIKKAQYWDYQVTDCSTTHWLPK